MPKDRNVIRLELPDDDWVAISDAVAEYGMARQQISQLAQIGRIGQTRVEDSTGSIVRLYLHRGDLKAYAAARTPRVNS